MSFIISGCYCTELELSSKKSAGGAPQACVCFLRNIPGRDAVALNLLTFLYRFRICVVKEGAWHGLMGA